MIGEVDLVWLVKAVVRASVIEPFHSCSKMDTFKTMLQYNRFLVSSVSFLTSDCFVEIIAEETRGVQGYHVNRVAQTTKSQRP